MATLIKHRGRTPGGSDVRGEYLPNMIRTTGRNVDVIRTAQGYFEVQPDTVWAYVDVAEIQNINTAVAAVIEDSGDFEYRDTILEMLSTASDVRGWAQFFPRMGLIIEGLLSEYAKQQGVEHMRVLPEACLRDAALKWPMYYIEFCHSMFGDDDWVHYYSMFPEAISAYDIPNRYPDVHERWKQLIDE